MSVHDSHPDWQNPKFSFWYSSIVVAVDSIERPRGSSQPDYDTNNALPIAVRLTDCRNIVCVLITANFKFTKFKIALLTIFRT